MKTITIGARVFEYQKKKRPRSPLKLVDTYMRSWYLDSTLFFKFSAELDGSPPPPLTRPSWRPVRPYDIKRSPSTPSFWHSPGRRGSRSAIRTIGGIAYLNSSISTCTPGTSTIRYFTIF